MVFIGFSNKIFKLNSRINCDKANKILAFFFLDKLINHFHIHCDLKLIRFILIVNADYLVSIISEEVDLKIYSFQRETNQSQYEYNMQY